MNFLRFTPNIMLELQVAEGFAIRFAFRFAFKCGGSGVALVVLTTV